MNQYVIIAYVVWNFGVFLLYGIDKWKAKAGAWRIPEKTLILCAVFFGAVGAYFGMKKFRHKTKHTKFRVLIPMLVVLNLVIIAAFGIAPEKTLELLKKLDTVSF
ncbi:MAG: DUF1294 domain-containing protein [Oscillospiraceae bacterium]|nr:DUF1294 domain-containing protein [Oscillospiraceae bacterium]